MGWACILLPRLGLDAALRALPEPHPPAVLVARRKRQQVLQAVNPAAAALGLTAGMPLSSAETLLQGFLQLHADAALEQHSHHLLAAWAYAYSAQVSTHYPQALLLEVGASLRLLGPWSQLQQRLRAELQAMGYAHRVALAPWPLAARALAGAHDGLVALDAPTLQAALGDLPLARVGFAPDVVQTLAGMGLHRLQQLEALPRASVRRRFPAGVLQHLDALYGRHRPALPEYRPPDTFDARLELGFPTALLEALWFPLRRLLQDLALCLRQRDGGVQRFALVLEHEDQPPTPLQVGLLKVEREASALFEVARCRLERQPLSAPVTALRLQATELPPFMPLATDLFAARSAGRHDWSQLAERLRARLGEQALQQISPHADHRPEKAWRTATPPPPRPDPSLQRPGWLLAEPHPLPTPPAHILSGPERLESGWWDGQDLRRDYYRVQLDSGQQAWVYRAPGVAHWMLQGWFG